MKNEFNDCNEFEKDLVDILVNLIKERLKDTIEYSIATHDIKPLKQILEILYKNKKTNVLYYIKLLVKSSGFQK